MIKHLILVAMLSTCAAQPASDDGDAPPPAPEGEATIIGVQVEPPEKAAEVWLEKIETTARDTKTLQAKVRWDRIQGLVGDEQRRFGRVVYVAGPPSKFAVHFDRLLLDGGRVEQQDRWWIFDGQWLVERLGDKKQYFKRQIAPPQDQVKDPLAEGAGPFPIPLKADKAELLRRFDVRVVEPAEGDPANTVHLSLKPRDPAQVEYSVIELWYDRDTLLPVRARTVKDASRDEQVFHLNDVKLNEPVDEAQIDTRAPSERGESGWLEQTD